MRLAYIKVLSHLIYLLVLPVLGLMLLELQINKNELRHEISNNVVCVTSKASDKPAHMGSLIRAFASPLNIQ